MRLKTPNSDVDASGASYQYITSNISRIPSSHETWQNLSDSSLIEQTRLNHNNLHPSISSEPLIEDEMPNPTVTPKFSYFYECSLTENIFLDVSSYRIV